jgi:hypothetical protein
MKARRLARAAKFGRCQWFGVPPVDYLKDVLVRVATHPQRFIHQLTPKGWLETFGRRAAALLTLPESSSQAGSSPPGSSQLGSRRTRAAGTALQARYQRVKSHRGHKNAVVATGHHLLVIAYHILAKDMTYQELGADYFDRRHRDRAIRRRIKQLEQLGYKVTLEESAA